MSSQNPEISVIIPVYNAEEFLDETISSVLSQTFKNFEFIIVNDKSTDSSKEIIQKYAKRDKRIIVLNNPKNMGCVNTRNRGIKKAKGKYIVAFDADDVCLPERFEIQFNYLEKHPEIYMVGGSAIIIDEKGNKLGVFSKYNNPKKVTKKLETTNCMLHPSIMHRNTQEFFYREKFSISDDYDFILSVLSAGKKITNLSDFVIKYRVNQNSATFIKKNPDYFYQKAKEFYKQRIETGKDDYENFKDPEKKISIDSGKSNLKIKIVAEFHDNQRKKVRRDIKKYFKNYGFNLPFTGYYVLSLLPTKLFRFLRQKV